MKTRILAVIVCCALLAGCAYSMKQHANMVSAIHGKLTLVSYNRTFIAKTFGPPDSRAVSSVDGIRTETWIYKTNLGPKDLILNMRPQNARYLKITMSNDIVTDVTVE